MVHLLAIPLDHLPVNDCSRRRQQMKTFSEKVFFQFLRQRTRVKVLGHFIKTPPSITGSGSGEVDEPRGSPTFIKAVLDGH